MRPIYKKITIAITAIFLIVLFIVSSYADSNKLTINFEENNVNFKIYNIKQFDIYGLDYNDKNIANMMVSLIYKNNIKETYCGVINNKKLEINNIPDGCYLVIGQNFVKDNIKYSFLPTIIKIKDNVEITPKYEKENVGKINLEVIKTWKDSKNTHNEISVSLYENGNVIQTVVLNTENNFKYVFENLDNKNEYTVFEDKIPANYTLSINRNGNKINLINTENPSPSEEKEKLPQTGLLRWPILYLMVLGVISIFLSFIITKYRKIFLSLALVFIIFGIILFLNNETESLEAANASNITVNKIIMEIQEKDIPVKDITEDTEFLEEIPEMEVMNIDGIDYIGTLEIPSQELLLPVTADWSYSNLKLSPCRYAGSIYTNDFVICAHNYNTHFGVLKNLQIGDIIYFRTVNNEIIEYSVVEMQILDPYSIDEMKNSEFDLTLFTCTYGGAQRVTVRANKK